MLVKCSFVFILFIFLGNFDHSAYFAITIKFFSSQQYIFFLTGSELIGETVENLVTKKKYEISRIWINDRDSQSRDIAIKFYLRCSVSFNRTTSIRRLLQLKLLSQKDHHGGKWMPQKGLALCSGYCKKKLNTNLE